RTTLLCLVDAESAASGRVMEAFRIPKDSPGREEAIQNALIHATEVPARTATDAAEALRVLESLQPVIHPNVASDLSGGFQMLRSAIEGGIANMRINLRDIKDPSERTRFEDMIREIEAGRITS